MKRTGMKTTKPPFDADAARRFAEEALRCPPRAPHVTRPDRSGQLVASFVLPLDCAQPQNRTRHGQAWALERIKSKVKARMRQQQAPRSEPLPGRPRVLCCRFSSVRPDRYADGFKAAIDVLCAAPPPLTRDGKLRKHMPTGRLGFLRDDSDAHADVVQWWEPAPPGRGFGLIEVWTEAHRKGWVARRDRVLGGKGGPPSREDGRRKGNARGQRSRAPVRDFGRREGHDRGNAALKRKRPQ